MNRKVLTALVGSTLLVSALTAATAGAAPARQASARHSARVCAAAPVGYAACHARVVVDGTGKPLVTPTPSG
jgi:hypothetical protein